MAASTKGYKPVKAVIMHLSSNTSEDITLALHKLGYKVVKSQADDCQAPLSRRGSQPYIPSPVRSHPGEKPEVTRLFKISNLCKIIVKVEAYKSKSGLTQCNNCQCFGHIWVHCRQPPRCLWCRGDPNTENSRRRRMAPPFVQKEDNTN
jgi:hypothetical protein